MLEIGNKKVFITHGTYKYIPLIGDFEGDNVFHIRNTNKYLPLPLKFRDILREYWLRWYHIDKYIDWHRKKVHIDQYIDGAIEFTIAKCVEEHLWTISICYPYPDETRKRDQFKRREGVNRAFLRMCNALENPYVSKKYWWCYKLEK